MSLFLYPKGAAFAATKTLRTNLATTPHAAPTGVPGAIVAEHGTGGAGTLARNAGAGADGRAGFTRYTRTTAATSGQFVLDYREPIGLPATVGPGVSYVVSAYVRSSVFRPVSVRFVNGFGSLWFGSINGSAVLQANTWTRVSFIANNETGPGVEQIGIGIEFNGQNLAAGATIDIGCILIEPATALLPYFDGAGLIPSAGALQHPQRVVWDGAADLAPSRLVEGAYAGEVRPPLLREFGEEHDAGHTTLRPFGRTAGPIVVLGPGVTWRRGRLAVFCPTRAEAQLLVAAHRAGPVSLRDLDDPTRDMDYVAPMTSVAEYDDDTAVPRYVVTADYEEVPR